MATRESDDLPTLDVTSRGTRFVDNEGRTLTLRGVNLGGAKLPANYRSDQSEDADWRLFVELPPADLGLCSFPDLREGTHYVHAPHWYDQLTLFFGHFRSWFSLDAATLEPALGPQLLRALAGRGAPAVEAVLGNAP